MRTQYAHYVSDTQVTYPSAQEFAGIPNWQDNDTALRAHGYVPISGTPEERPGFIPVPSRYRYNQLTEQQPRSHAVIVTDYDPVTHEPIGQHTEYVTELEDVDVSTITITDYTYDPEPVPEPEPRPTKFLKPEVVEALIGCNYYDIVVSFYQQEVSLQIYWATYSYVDLAHPRTQEIISMYPGILTNEVINELVDWIIEYRRQKGISLEDIEVEIGRM